MQVTMEYKELEEIKAHEWQRGHVEGQRLLSEQLIALVNGTLPLPDDKDVHELWGQYDHQLSHNVVKILRKLLATAP